MKGYAGTGSARSYAIGPDGRILYLAFLSGPTEGQLPVLVTNWEGELPDVTSPRE